MFTVQHIDSFGLPELQPYQTMRRQWEHREQGIFVAEGAKVVRRLLESRFIVRSVLMPEKWLAELQPLIESRAEPVHVFLAPKKLLENLTGFSMYQGLLAVGQVPEQRTLEQVLDTAPRPLLLAAADGLSSAENVGTMVRNCAAFGANALITSPTCASPFLRRAVRSSMGTIFNLPVVEAPDVSAALRFLKTRGVYCVAAHPHRHDVTLSRAKLQDCCCLLFGSEDAGIRPELLDLCDQAVAIPMTPDVDSLNVSSAAAAFLYEAARQRGTS
jgi:tRNA G18 (ribose-2'-O)-methylase SpoU